MTSSHSLAVDIGGTFTDLVVLELESGAVRHEKAETTPREPARGVLAALEKADLTLASARTFFHGTTLGLNAMLERKAAGVALVTTRGFRDVLELRRLSWPMYRLHWQAPEPLVPRYLRREVTERIRADGVELAALDEEELVREAAFLVGEGIRSIAICFVHAYAFPAHELRAAEILAAEFPEVVVTLSHQVSREYREYERTVTTVVDAAIKPLMATYIDELDRSLRAAEFAGTFVLTRCDGGVMGAAEARQRPVRTVLSGPASGVMGAVALGRWLGIPNLIAADMGGTSFDAALIIDHKPALSTVAEIGDLALLMPVVELATIGAGGGSIARLDAGGALEVGPESAGSEPGPVCYGKGGAAPTFTDAALVSGLLDPTGFLGGEIDLDVRRARDAIGEIAEPLGLSIEEAAAGIVALTETKMAATLEELTIEKGHDPRDFALLAYGGGGSLVAAALAAKLEIRTIVVPRSPGTFSAWGMLTLDVVHDFSRTAVAPLSDLGADQLQAPFEDLFREARAALEREHVPPERWTFARSLDLRYEGQEHVLTLELPQALSAARIRELFDRRHAATYGYELPDGVEVTAYRVRAAGMLDKPRQPHLPEGSDAAPTPRRTRRAHHRSSGGELEWDVYERVDLHSRSQLAGPAIVEEAAATTLVPPGWLLKLDELGNLLLEAT